VDLGPWWSQLVALNANALGKANAQSETSVWALY